MTADQKANLAHMDRFASMTAACAPSERELREPVGGTAVVAEIVKDYEEAHLGALKAKTVRQPVTLPPEWRLGMTAAGFDETKHPRHSKGEKGGGRFRTKAEIAAEIRPTVLERGGTEEGVQSLAAHIEREEARNRDWAASEPTGIGVNPITENDESYGVVYGPLPGKWDDTGGSLPPIGYDDEVLVNGKTKLRINARGEKGDWFYGMPEEQYQELAKARQQLTIFRAGGKEDSPEYNKVVDKITSLSDGDIVIGEGDTVQVTGRSAGDPFNQAALLTASASGYQSEQAARREFLSSLTAAGKLRSEESESENEDNERYADEECPDCGSMTGTGALCASCGGKRALTAAAMPTGRVRGIAPANPPRDWFEIPEIDGLMPLTITADGQVMGHVAGWGSCHTGFPGRCTQPPPSPSGYSYFHTGALELEDGSTIPVGRLTFDTGHASLTASRAAAAAHYDNTGKVGAFVRAQDGKHGIWVCGATRCDLDEPELQTLRASAPSGDWRRPAPGKPMEMVGLLSVNVAGFPVPRGQAMVAAAPIEEQEEVMAMVAAGFEDMIVMADAYYARQLEVIAMIAAGTLLEHLMTPMERRMAMTAAVEPGERDDIGTVKGIRAECARIDKEVAEGHHSEEAGNAMKRRAWLAHRSMKAQAKLA